MSYFLPRYMEKSEPIVTNRLSDYFGRHTPEVEKLAYIPESDTTIPLSEYLDAWARAEGIRRPEPQYTRDRWGYYIPYDPPLESPGLSDIEWFYPWKSMVNLTRHAIPAAMAGTAGLFTKFTDKAQKASKSTVSDLTEAAKRALEWGHSLNVDRQQLISNPYARIRLFNTMKQYVEALPKGSVARQVAEKYVKSISDPRDPSSVVRLENAAQAVHAAMRSQIADLSTMVKTEFGTEAPIIVNKLSEELLSSYPKRQVGHVYEDIMRVIRNTLKDQRGSWSKKDIRDLIRSERHKGYLKGSRLEEATSPVTVGKKASEESIIVTDVEGEPVVTLIKQTKSPTHEYTVGELMQILKGKHTPEDVRSLMKELFRRLEQEKKIGKK